MANYTGADVITTSDVLKYQPDAFDFGISTTATETVNFLAQTTKCIIYNITHRNRTKAANLQFSNQSVVSQVSKRGNSSRRSENVSLSHSNQSRSRSNLPI